MIDTYKGDIFNTKAEMIAVPVNVYGVSGAGMAKFVRERFPFEMSQYAQACRRKYLTLGSVFFVRCLEDNEHIFNVPKFLVMFPTKNHWTKPSELWMIEKSAHALARQSKFFPVKTIALPKVGCGLGGLDWKDVKPVLIREFKKKEQTFLLPE